ncbi:hypothetical protein ATK17_3792 [Branchiibius hedensis]|uniref:Uncharacterized protein n=1 Tax=Branchiibius hedensis TaxID=672460 RepID=A0A2Y9BLI4_9MICO|nr:hypothetical protein [Branchiibius hedensis]PWJ23298.1 hypothetical protein ATK17_3792 [Branchiibius hedensis]SSA58987.1 hypothetical protein SAMN04489750_3792 [Branchiibius hedensis]
MSSTTKAPDSSAPTMSVSELTLSDVGPDLIHIIDGSDAHVDGIGARADMHPAFDPAGAINGESGLLVTFTDAHGRNRIAEVSIIARWREDDCWHLHTRPGVLGRECRDCGTVVEAAAAEE